MGRVYKTRAQSSIDQPYKWVEPAYSKLRRACQKSSMSQASAEPPGSTHHHELNFFKTFFDDIIVI